MKKTNLSSNNQKKNFNFISDWYHESSKVKTSNKILEIASVPRTWIDIHFKTYPRFKTIKLEIPRNIEKSLGYVLHSRESKRDYKKYKINLEEISTLLGLSCGIVRRIGKGIDKTHRSHPSAGARYPIETYLLLLNSKLDQGVYHYNIKNHQLEILEIFSIKNKLKKIFLDADQMINTCSAIVVLTAIFDRSRVKYGERGFRYALIEIGHIAQNLALVGTSLELDVCAYGGFIEDKMDNLLDLDSRKETAVYSIFFGK